MSNFSRTAVSLAPAYFHHCRSKSRISRSRSLSPGVASASPWRASAASMVAPPPRLRAVVGWPAGTGQPHYRRANDTDVIRRAASRDATVRTMAQHTSEEIGWGILATGKIAHTFARDLAL